MGSERRQVNRFNIALAAFSRHESRFDKSEHFTEALNICDGGFFFASSAPLQWACPSMHAAHAGGSDREQVAARRIVRRASCMCGTNLRRRPNRVRRRNREYHTPQWRTARRLSNLDQTRRFRNDLNPKGRKRRGRLKSETQGTRIVVLALPTFSKRS